jgi:hypothetical protein
MGQRTNFEFENKVDNVTVIVRSGQNARIFEDEAAPHCPTTSTIFELSGDHFCEMAFCARHGSSGVPLDARGFMLPSGSAKELTREPTWTSGLRLESKRR